MEQIHAPSFARPRRQRGFVMIELILGIVVALSLVVGAFWLLIEAREQDRDRMTASELAVLQVEMRSRFLHAAAIPAGDYSEELARTTNLRNPGRTPSAPLTSPGGGQIQVVADGDASFTIVMRDLPARTCSKIIQLDDDGTGPFGTGVLEVGSDPSGISHVPVRHGPLGPLEMSVMCGAKRQDLAFRLAK